MKFTNKYNLDQWICDFLAEDNYDFQPGTISATTLIGPARAWALKQLHPDDLVADYSDFIKTKNGDSGTMKEGSSWKLFASAASSGGKTARA